MPSNQTLSRFFFNSCLVYQNNFLLSNCGEMRSHLVSLRLLGGENSTWLITSKLADQHARKYYSLVRCNQNYSGTAVSCLVPEMHRIALAVNGLFYLGVVPFSIPPHPYPNPSGCAHVSVMRSHCLIMAEGQQHLNYFLT